MTSATTPCSDLPARASYQWLQREEDLLFNVSMGTREDCSVLDLAAKMARHPMDVAKRILQSEIPEMIGFNAAAGSEEEAEFLGLALAGVSLQVILRWCIADDQRPTSQELERMMTAPDMRPALYMACATGMWLCGPTDRSALLLLASQPQVSVEAAVRDVLRRFDAPTPTVVAKQLLGMYPTSEQELPWSGPAACPSKASRTKRSANGTGTTSVKKPRRKTSSGTGSSRFSSDAARRKFWAKRNAKRKSYG